MLGIADPDEQGKDDGDDGSKDDGKNDDGSKDDTSGKSVDGAALEAAPEIDAETKSALDLQLRYIKLMSDTYGRED
jgi:hypothetical protein